MRIFLTLFGRARKPNPHSELNYRIPPYQAELPNKRQKEKPTTVSQLQQYKIPKSILIRRTVAPSKEYKRVVQLSDRTVGTCPKLPNSGGYQGGNPLEVFWYFWTSKSTYTHSKNKSNSKIGAKTIHTNGNNN